MITAWMEKMRSQVTLLDGFAFCYAFFFFYPPYFKNLAFDLINQALFLVAAVVLFSGRYRCSRTALWVIGYVVLGAAISFYHQIPDANLRFLVRCCRQLTFVLYMDYLLQISRPTVLRYVFGALAFWVGLDLLSVFAFPSGLHRRYESNGWATWLASVSWLYGHKNIHAMYFLLTQLLLWMNYEAKSISLTKKQCLYLSCLPLLASCIMRSTTTILALLLAVIGLGMSYKVWERPWPRLKLEYVVSGYLGLVACYILLSLEQVRTLIGFDYSKLLSFTGRSTIWAKALSFVPDHFFLGLGLVDLDTAAALLENTFFCNAHNMFLDVLWKGGIVYFAFFLALLFAFCRSLKKAAEPAKANMLVCFFLALLAQMTMESFILDSKFFLVLLLLVYIAETPGESKGEEEAENAA